MSQDKQSAMEAAFEAFTAACYTSDYWASMSPHDRQREVAYDRLKHEKRLPAAILAYLETLAGDEGTVEACAEQIADAMNMNRPGRLEDDAARAVLRTLATRAQGESL
jgi:hypothetical protein